MCWVSFWFQCPICDICSEPVDAGGMVARRTPVVESSNTYYQMTSPPHGDDQFIPENRGKKSDNREA